MPAEKGRVMICGTTNVNLIESRAIVEFDRCSEVTAEHDVFVLSAPNGGYLSLYPVGNDGDGLLVSAETAPAEYRLFRLMLIEGNRWQLVMLDEGRNGPITATESVSPVGNPLPAS